MKKYRYSEVLSEFYSIGVATSDKISVDIFFTGAAHHYHMFKTVSASELQNFHLTHMHLHMVQLKRIVYLKSDFSMARDPSLREMQNRESWNPNISTLPHPNMFNSMAADPTCEAGQAHACDFYIKRVFVGSIPLAVGGHFSSTH